MKRQLDVRYLTGIYCGVGAAAIALWAKCPIIAAVMVFATAICAFRLFYTWRV